MNSRSIDSSVIGDATEFWSQIVITRKKLELAIDQSNVSEVVGIIDPLVKKLPGKLRWEVGPGTSASYMLAFGLNGDLDNLALTKAVVSVAPHLPGWEVHPARPPKRWGLWLELSNARGATISIDVSNWQYYLTMYQDDTFVDITILAKNLSRCDQSAQNQAARTALLNELGELALMSSIGTIDVITVVPRDPALSDSLSEFPSLRDHLRHLGLFPE